MRALPGHWAHSRVLGTLPWVVPVISAPSEMRCTESPDGWPGREETGAVAAGDFPKVPQRVFFFLGKILLLTPVAPSVQGRACPLTQPTSPARPGAVPVRIAHGPTLLSQHPWSLWVFQFVLIPLPATSGNQVSLSYVFLIGAFNQFIFKVIIDK